MTCLKRSTAGHDMFSRCLILLLLCSAPWPLANVVAGMTLVKDGEPACTIVIAPGAGQQERFAAEELQRYLQKMSGAETPITTVPGVAGNRILIGVFGSEPVQPWQGDRPRPDGFAIETREHPDQGMDLFLVGGDDRGALYAVYELLERFLDVRWFMPIEAGEEVPVRTTVELGELHWENSPDFAAIIGLRWGHGPQAIYDWERRNKAVAGPPGYFFGHNWVNIISHYDAERRGRHPEWFALAADGYRSHQLCSSHPDVIRISAEKAREYFERNPDLALFSLSPNDGHGFCVCARCRQIDRKYGVTDGSHTDRLIHYANQVLAELEKTHPDKLVGIYAYVTHTRPPVSARPHPNYVTVLCRMPWEFCHVHPINDPDCKPNTRFREYIEGWAQVCEHVGIYDYYGHYMFFTPWPLLRIIGKEIPYLHQLGVQGFMSETQQNWANQGVNFYLAAKLLWDAKGDPEQVLDDFYKRFYGPAQEPMRRYWESWENAMAKQPCGGYRWLAMLTPELIANTGDLLAEAEEMAGKDSRFSRRLELHRIGYRFTEAFARMRWHGEAGAWHEAIEAGEEAVRIIEEVEHSEPQAFAYTALTRSQTLTQIQPYRRKLEAAQGGDDR